jgi:hypothetical protein
VLPIELIELIDQDRLVFGEFSELIMKEAGDDAGY